MSDPVEEGGGVETNLVAIAAAFIAQGDGQVSLARSGREGHIVSMIPKK